MENEKKSIKSKDLKKVYFLQWTYFFIISFAIFFSLLALAIPKKYNESFKSQIALLQFITFIILVVDYILLAITSPTRFTKSHWPFLKFFFSFTSLFLLLGILSSLYTLELFLEREYAIIKFLKAFSIIKMVRLAMLLTFFSSFQLLIQVFRKEKVVLINVFAFIVFLILVLSLIIWNSEVNFAEEQIENGVWMRDGENGYNLQTNIVKSYWDAIYFTTISLTTIGYGDIVPFAPQTKAIVIFTSLIGIAIFAIPSGVIAGSFLNQVQNKIKNGQENNLKNN